VDSGFSCLWTESIDRLLWTWWWIFGFHEAEDFFWPTKIRFYHCFFLSLFLTTLYELHTLQSFEWKDDYEFRRMCSWPV
jgi:hypothetical protein